MASWGDLERAEPRIAAEGRRLLYAPGHGTEGKAFLATVRGDGPIRIHPITVQVVGAGLYAFINTSPKQGDLREDGRYALHTYHDPEHPAELALRGHARLVDARAERDPIAADWPFEPDATYTLFEFLIESAVLGERAADEWPPRYTRWTPAA
jgi:Pyridoxamine 5'-phosphate oxidase